MGLDKMHKLLTSDYITENNDSFFSNNLWISCDNLGRIQLIIVSHECMFISSVMSVSYEENCSFDFTHVMVFHAIERILATLLLIF